MTTSAGEVTRPLSSGAAAEAARAMNRWLIDAIDQVASVGIAEPGTDESDTLESLLQRAGTALFRIAPLSSGGFFLLDSARVDFPLTWCEPRGDRDNLVREIEALIANGVFAWALQHNHPVLVAGLTHGGSSLLHVLTSRGGPGGMFLGMIPDRAPYIPDGCQKLISIVVTSCASRLRSEELRAELKRINRSLESAIEARTAELRQARDSAFRAAQVKSEFLANMSHEIRTPMNAVLGTTAMLLESGLTPDQRALAETIDSSGRDLLTIINDILDFSKLEAGKLRIECITFDLPEIASSVVQLLSPKAEAKGIRLRYRIGPGTPRLVVGDPGRLRQILTNLMDNAIRFTEQGLVLVHVAAAEPVGDVVPINFVVRDTGIGIPREKLTAIFEKFTQADTSTTRRFGGTGLGLAICRQLTELMGGGIAAESAPGEGSTFTVTIPFQAASGIEAAIDPAAPAPQRLSGRVLLAEDYPANRRIACWMLERLGLEVEVASDGKEALARLNSGRFDLILMDCQMPELDGYEATKVIRAAGTDQSSIPIIAMTASALPADRDRCLAVGMNDFIAKPVQQEQLAKSLGRWLRQPKV